MSFTLTNHCKSRAHCNQCRQSKSFRSLVNAPDICPFGITATISTIDKAISLSKSTAEWAINGFKKTPIEDFKKRLSICLSCEFWNKSGFAGTGSCEKCGCSTQAKLRMATSKCPIGKWAEEENNS